MTTPISHDDFSRHVAGLYPKIYLAALAFSRDSDTAQDIAQEAFLRAFLHRDKLRHPDDLGPWVYGIALKIARQWQRDRQNRSRLLPLIPLEEVTMHPPDNAPSPGDAAASAESSQQVSQAVMALPTEMREVILLHYSDGMTASDIARLNGEAVSTITRRLDRALKLLRQQMDSNFLAGLATFRPHSAQSQRTVMLLAATAGLSAGARSSLAALATDTLLPAASYPAGLAPSAKEGSSMKTILSSTATKSLVAGAVILTGALAVRSLSQNDHPRADSSAAATETTALHTQTHITEIRAISTGTHRPSPAASNDAATTLSSSRADRADALRQQIRQRTQEIRLAGGVSATTSSLHGRPPRPGEIPRVNQMESTGTITGIVYDPAGRPLPDAQVKTCAWWFPDSSQVPADIDPRFIQPVQAIMSEDTDANGQFELKHLPYGSRLTIGVISEEFAIARQIVDVPSANVKIYLKPATRKVQGRVLNFTDDSPVQGARLNFHVVGPIEISFAGEVRKGQAPVASDFARTAADGTYELLRLPEGEVIIEAEAANLAPLPTVNAVHNTTATIAAGAAPQEIPPIYLYPGHTVVGTVRDADTGEPIPEAIVSSPFLMGMTNRASASDLSVSDGGPSAVTDAAGNFVVPGVRPRLQSTDGSSTRTGTAFNRLSATHPDYITARQEPQVTTVERNSLEIRMDFELTRRR